MPSGRERISEGWLRRRGQLLGGDYPRRLAVLSGNSSRPWLVGVTDMDAGIGCSRISPLARYRPGRISTRCWMSSGTRPRRQWEFDCVGGALSGPDGGLRESPEEDGRPHGAPCGSTRHGQDGATSITGASYDGNSLLTWFAMFSYTCCIYRIGGDHRRAAGHPCLSVAPPQMTYPPPCESFVSVLLHVGGRR
jgi:hypothetical protein